MNIDTERFEKLYSSICTTREHHYVYGTAGFRDNADILDTVMFTTGILACLRSMFHKGKAIGVMITASHNPPHDNGVKIIEPTGAMLDQSWEAYSTEIANIAANKSAQDVIDYTNELIVKLQIDASIVPSITVGMDSRESSPYLMECLLATPTLFNAKIKNHGMLTTPQLHFLTNYQNEHPNETVSVKNYDIFFQNNWNKLLKLYNITDFTPESFVNVNIDAANGIGAPQFESFVKALSQATRFKFINDNYLEPSTLNSSCGADFVKTGQKLPHGITDVTGHDTLFCSFDGDADRIVFYYIDQEKQDFHLLDGDKIATLFAYFLQNLLSTAELTQKIKLGVVQTAYANGSSTEYLTSNLNCPVSCAKTGVKHLHHEAQASYDVGVYFEANGHGTIIFSPEFESVVSSHLSSTDDGEVIKACETLILFSHLINQTVGDAIADLLGVLSTLLIMKWTPKQWDNEYTDLPNLLAKVIVPDRSVFITADQERKLVSPPTLQAQMNKLIDQVPQGRAFVRASGTEDAVRIYCEGSEIEQVKKLSRDIEKLILDTVN